MSNVWIFLLSPKQKETIFECTTANDIVTFYYKCNSDGTSDQQLYEFTSLKDSKQTKKHSNKEKQTHKTTFNKNDFPLMYGWFHIHFHFLYHMKKKKKSNIIDKTSLEIYVVALCNPSLLVKVKKGPL